MTRTDRELTDSTEGEIDRFLDDWLFEHDGPGASVAVFDDEGVLYATGYGSRDLDGNAPATADTLYTVGSITKTFTAVAILQLADRGELALNDEIREYVPFLNDVPGDPITVRELLSHSAGTPLDYVAHRDNIATTRDLQLHVDGAADRRVIDDPPTMYTNSGYKVLGEIVAAVDGRSYADYVTEEVLAPLGMDRSTYDQMAPQTADDAMTGYVFEDDEPVPFEGPVEHEAQMADGGLISSMPELTRLWRCLLAGGELEGTRILEPDTVEAMTSPQAAIASTVDGAEDAFGYGLMLENFFQELLVGHAGGLWHAQAYVGALPERELGVALAVNAAIPVPPAAKGVLAIVAGESPERAVPGLALEAKLEAVAGTYEAYRDGETATVEPDAGHLSVTFERRGVTFPAFPETLDPEDYTFYRVDHTGRRRAVEFRATDEGMTLLYRRDRLDRT